MWAYLFLFFFFFCSVPVSFSSHPSTVNRPTLVEPSQLNQTSPLEQANMNQAANLFLSILDFSNISRSRQRKTIEAREIPRIGFDQQTFYPLVVVVLRFWEGWAVTRGLLQPGTTRCYRTRPFFMTRQGTHTRFAKFQYETERRNPSPPSPIYSVQRLHSFYLPGQSIGVRRGWLSVWV